MKAFISALVWLPSLALAAAPAVQEERIPVLAWIGPPANQTTIERYRELDPSGKRTAVYDRVKGMNGEILPLSWVFLGSKVIAIGHTGEKIPRGTKRFEPRAPVKELKTEGPGALVSLLEKGGRRFLVIVSRDILKTQGLTLDLDGSAPIERVKKDGSTEKVGGRRLRMELEPGDAAILAWMAG